MFARLLKGKRAAMPRQRDLFAFEGLEERRLMSATVDVRSFGAALNGVADDSAAIQKAINALPADGGVVQIPGIAGIGAGGILLSNRNNVTLLGVGSTGGLRALAVSGQIAGYGHTMIKVSFCTSCTIQGMQIQGNGINQNTIDVENSSDVTISGNVVSNVGVANAVVVTAGNVGNHYTNNSFYNTGARTGGFWIGNAVPETWERGAVISGNRVESCGGTGIGAGPGAQIIGNTVQDCAGAGIGIGIARSDANLGQTVIDGNSVMWNAQGIQADSMSDSVRVDNVIVRNNDARGNLYSGIYAVRVSHWTITGNTSRDNGTVSNLGTGIYISNARDVVVSGNTAYDSRRLNDRRTQAVGIAVLASTYALDVQNIELSGNRVDTNRRYGIFITPTNHGTMSGIQVLNNTMTGNTVYGLLIPGSVAGETTNVKVSGNLFSGNGTTGVRIDPLVGLV